MSSAAQVQVYMASNKLLHFFLYLILDSICFLLYIAFIVGVNLLAAGLTCTWSMDGVTLYKNKGLKKD